MPGKTPLDDVQVAANALELKQLEKSDILAIVLPRLPLGEEDKAIGDFLVLVAATGVSLCAQTVESKLVERLRHNTDLAQWVEQGLLSPDARVQNMRVL